VIALDIEHHDPANLIRRIEKLFDFGKIAEVGLPDTSCLMLSWRLDSARRPV
jgi:hypothetical protein